MGLRKQMEAQVVAYKEKLAAETEEKLRLAIKEIEERIIATVDARIRKIVKEEIVK